MEEQHNSFYNGNKTLYVISESTGDKKLQITEVLPREKRRTKSQGNFSPSPYTISKNLLRETTTTTTTWEKLNLQNFLRGGGGAYLQTPLEARLKRLKKLPIFTQKELIYANSPRLSKSYRGEKTWGEMTSYRFHRYSGEGGGNSLEILVLHAGHDSLQISQYWLGFALIWSYLLQLTSLKKDLKQYWRYLAQDEAWTDRGKPSGPMKPAYKTS